MQMAQHIMPGSWTPKSVSGLPNANYTTHARLLSPGLPAARPKCKWTVFNAVANPLRAPFFVLASIFSSHIQADHCERTKPPFLSITNFDTMAV